MCHWPNHPAETPAEPEDIQEEIPVQLNPLANQCNVSEEVSVSTITLKVKGMTCGHCEQAVARGLQKVQGVERAAVSHGEGTAVVETASDTDPEQLIAAVQEEGYEAMVAT